MKKKLKKIIAGFIAGFCAFALILQVPKVNSWIVQSLFNLYLPQSYRVSIDRIYGTFPFEIKIKRIMIHDRNGRWLKLKGIHYSWRGVDLFFKKITFDHFTVEAAKLYRIPESTAASINALPDHLPKINIHKLTINDFSAFGAFHTLIKGDLTTKRRDNHYLSLKFYTPEIQAKVFEVNSSLIQEKLAINFSMDNTAKEVADLFPQLHGYIHDGKISSLFELYSTRHFDTISGYFIGQLKNLESTHPFIEKVIGHDLQWTINTSFKPQEDDYRLVAKIFSEGGVKIKWDTQLHPKAQNINAQSTIKLPHIQQFHFLGNAYDGTLLLESDVKNNEMNWTLSGLTYRQQSLAASHGRITFHKIFPFLDIDFHGQIHAPGLSPEVSGSFQQDTLGWAIKDLHIKDQLADVRLSFHKNLNPSLHVDAHVSDLSRLKPITGLDLVGDNKVTCLINEGQGKCDVDWSHNDTQGHGTALINIFKDSVKKSITVQELILAHNQQPIVQLQNPWVFNWNEDRLSYDATSLQMGEGQWEVTDGHIGKTLDGQVFFKNIPLKTLTLLGIKEECQGTLNGHIKLQGTQESPEFKGLLKVEKVALFNINKKNVKHFDAELLLEKSPKDYHFLFTYQDALKSQVKGEGKIDSKTLIPEASASLDFTLEGSYNLPILNGFLNNGDRLKGALHFTQKASGTLSNPQLQGTFNLKDGMYENGELGLLIQKISINGQSGQGEIRIDRVEGRDVANGKVSGSGKIQWVGRKPLFSFNLDVQNMIVANSDLLLISADGKLHMNNEQDQLTIGGQLTINSGDAFLADTAPRTKLLKIRNDDLSLPTDPAKKLISLQKKTPPFGKMNLSIDIPQKIFIRGYGINSQWNGKLKLTGPINHPEIGGKLSLLRGQMDLIGKTLQLSDGTITFIPKEVDIDPLLNITATKSVNDIKAMIHIKGQSSRPEIDFSSTPILPQEEIVSLILFGKSLNSVTAAQSLQLAAAIASIKSASRNQSFAEQFRTAFGLDEIGIHGEDNGDDNNGELSTDYTLHVGKQLTDRAYIALKQGVTGEAGTDVWLRYDLTEQAKAELEAGTGRNANAVGFSWEKKY